MATVTPTLTITSSDALVDTLSLSVTTDLTVTADFGESMVFLKNLTPDSSARGSAPKIIVAFAAADELIIGKGEFALLPWDSVADLKIKHDGTGAAPYCEFAIFEF